MDALERDYRNAKTQYDSLIAKNNPALIFQVFALNDQLSRILHRMLEEVSKVRGGANNLKVYRDELMKKLIKIQNDSSILQKQKDQYETLRALKNHEKTKFDAALFWYMLSLGFFTIIFIIVLIWKGGYKLPEMPTMTSSATTMPALT